jgi:CheY-like chemotaxis protein
MVAKRALVVDDSKSARAFLARLLEEQQLEVDAAETAEQAIDYLAHNRPDVIFMDHLMPGMDGFQAVQAIKNNPRTAMIPILMYTSQEGELYLGQARALGAVGVLPKTVAPSDVRSVLQQLHLLPQPEPDTIAAQQDVLDAAVAVAAAVDSQVVPILAGPPVDELLRDEVAALRRYLAESLESHSQRVVGDVRSLLRELMPASPEPPPADPDSPGRNTLPWLLALATSVAAAVLGTLLWQHQQQLGTLKTELADSRSTVTLLAARLVPAPVPPSAVVDPAFAAASDVNGAELIARVPFGEAPLAGDRVDALRNFVARVATLGQKGTVEVRRHAGRFCLARSGTEGGYALAEGATPFSKCELVAEATDPQLGSAGTESVAFANALAELRRQHEALLTIDVGAVRGETGNTPYPETGGTPPPVLTAGEWNAIAERNNRVEFRWHPAT